MQCKNTGLPFSRAHHDTIYGQLTTISLHSTIDTVSHGKFVCTVRKCGCQRPRVTKLPEYSTKGIMLKQTKLPKKAALIAAVHIPSYMSFRSSAPDGNPNTSVLFSCVNSSKVCVATSSVRQQPISFQEDHASSRTFFFGRFSSSTSSDCSCAESFLMTTCVF